MYTQHIEFTQKKMGFDPSQYVTVINLNFNFQKQKDEK